MANKEQKSPTHFSLEPLVHEAHAKGSMHLSADTKRVALVLILAIASFLTVYFLSGSGEDVKTQLRFADDGSATPVPTLEATPFVATTPTSGSLAYNGFPDLGGNTNDGTANANQNGIASTVIRNSAYTVTNGNSNVAVPTSGNIPVRSPSPSPVATTAYPTATPRTADFGQYGVVGSGGEQMAPTPTPTPSPTSTPTPSPSSSPTPTAEPIKRGMEQSGPAAWMALLPVLMVGVFRLVRKV